MRIPTPSLFTLKTIALSICFIIPQSKAAVIFNESTSGDLSGIPSNPELLVVGSGTNTIVGSVGENGNTGASDASDADYFTLTIPFGLSIDSITIDNYSTSPNPSGSGSFLGYKSGTGFAGQGFGDIDSWALFNSSTINLLADLGLSSLESGSHTFWIQETTSTVVDYTISYDAVPEPSTYILLGMGLWMLMVFRKLKNKTTRCFPEKVIHFKNHSNTQQ